jgi:ABC-type multidrug transport system fused ATPase/permease subunit
MNVSDITDDQYWEALMNAQLHEFVSGLPEGLSTKVGSLGARLSGGQKQRLGIARALITKPKLLVLDEATSALDNVTEFEITKSLRELRGHVTIIVIAHRLSTIKDADEIIYLDNQNVLSRGTFERLVAEIPDFGENLS